MKFYIFLILGSPTPVIAGQWKMLPMTSKQKPTNVEFSSFDYIDWLQFYIEECGQGLVVAYNQHSSEMF